MSSQGKVFIYIVTLAYIHNVSRSSESICGVCGWGEVDMIILKILSPNMEGGKEGTKEEEVQREAVVILCAH